LGILIATVTQYLRCLRAGVRDPSRWPREGFGGIEGMAHQQNRNRGAFPRLRRAGFKWSPGTGVGCLGSEGRRLVEDSVPIRAAGGTVGFRALLERSP